MIDYKIESKLKTLIVNIAKVLLIRQSKNKPHHCPACDRELPINHKLLK